ncbi:MAG: lipase [Gemmatimonadetes bacterium]|nr:lipase [Gemmatimonadota bacterium]
MRRMPGRTGLARVGRHASLLLAAVVAVGCAKKDDSASGADSSATGAGSAARPAPAGGADPQMQAVLDKLAGLNGKPIETLAPAEARTQPTPTDAVKAVLASQGKSTAPPAGVTLASRTIPGAGGAMPTNIYTPDGAGPFPVIVYYHGGGWVIGSKDVYDGGARGLAAAAGAVVVSSDYRLAPEHKFPAAHDDALAAYRWALANAASIKGDPKRVALAGESAGGNLAVATAIAARDAKLQAPLAIISVYPIAGRDTTTPSYVEHAAAKPLNRPMMAWFFDKYQRAPADLADWRVNLVGADLGGLPPTTIINAQIDPLRSDGELLAERMRAAGVTVEQRTYEGVTHEFFGMAAVVDKARDAQTMAGNALRKAFGQ